MKKCFGKLNIKWWHVIVFAAVCGVYTGVMAMLPFLKDTSFQDITMTFECWILFAIILIVNAKSPLESALKTFVFFLISLLLTSPAGEVTQYQLTVDVARSSYTIERLE